MPRYAGSKTKNPSMGNSKYALDYDIRDDLKAENCLSVYPVSEEVWNGVTTTIHAKHS